MTTNVLDINSTWRDRVQYPEACDFVIELNGSNNYNTPRTATDPIILSFPYETNFTSGGSTASQIVLSVASSTILNYYRNSYLQIGNEYRLITAYDNTTQVATVDPAFSVAPLALTLYTIRYELPIELNGNYQDTLLVNAPDTTHVFLGANASSQDGIYENQYLFVAGPNPPYSYQWKLITKYVGATKKATLLNRFVTPLTAGAVYEIQPFSYNNVRPLRYNFTEVGVNNPVCKTISLLALIIPNRQVLNGYGGLVTDYPYVYVSIKDEGSMSYSSPIIANTPFELNDTLFKCPITFYNLTAFLSLISTGMSPKVPFKENASLRITIYLPNGEILQLEDDPNIILYSAKEYGGLLFPIPSNPFNQVNMTLQVSR